MNKLKIFELKCNFHACFHFYNSNPLFIPIPLNKMHFISLSTLGGGVMVPNSWIFFRAQDKRTTLHFPLTSSLLSIFDRIEKYKRSYNLIRLRNVFWFFRLFRIERFSGVENELHAHSLTHSHTHSHTLTYTCSKVVQLLELTFTDITVFGAVID